jgi:alpha-glucosidase
MWVRGTGGNSLDVTFPKYPNELEWEGNIYGQGRVKSTHDYIAKTEGNRTFPWRIFAIARDDADLINNQLVYLLAGESKMEDPSWIRPGIVAFDWWGKHNIYGVNFKSGINTATAKYFIDFAAEFGFDYFLLDDGWTDNTDLFNTNPDLDMEEVSNYALEKDVGLMLWLMWSTLDRQMEPALDRFEGWGVKGVKVDFMNRDDQQMVNFYWKVAEETAKRKMVVDFHGAYKPAGLRRTYPNILTREGLIEFETNGYGDGAHPEHHCLLPFVRMVAGPMDYIPGTMNNATKAEFRKVGQRPMGQGTRAHDIALFGILESPMQMLPDGPSDYYRERECTEFISKIPVEWDSTVVLDAKVGDYVSIARKHGDEWFVSAITDWDAREMKLDFGFLPEGEFKIEILRDGANADKRATDYILETKTVKKSDAWVIQLAPGGGWIGRICK